MREASKMRRTRGKHMADMMSQSSAPRRTLEKAATETIGMAMLNRNQAVASRSLSLPSRDGTATDTTIRIAGLVSTITLIRSQR